MYKGLAIAALAATLYLPSSNVSAQGLISNPAEALQEYCNYDSARRTIIYIDQNIVGKTDTQWYRPIVANQSYMPYERVQFKMINAQSGAVEDLWETCYPRHSDENFARLKENDSIFSKSVEDKQEDAQKFFFKAQEGALAQVLNDTPHNEKPSFNGSFPRKSLLEALYYDSAAYRLEGKTTRVILFSDMVENSEILNPAKLNSGKPVELAADAAKNITGNFNNAEFNVYGVGYSHGNNQLNRKLEAFWSHWLNYSGAQLASFGPQLMLNPESSDVSFTSYTGVLKSLDGMNIATRLRVGVTPSSKLYNSWLAIRDIRYPLEGDMVCEKGGAECSLSAKVSFAGSNAKLFEEGDVLRLSGKMDALKGSVGAPDELTRTVNGKPYTMKVVFDADANLSF
jgi:hypothetical protein